ncbi:MAG: ribonuclease Y [Cumulibacter sp.]
MPPVLDIVLIIVLVVVLVLLAIGVSFVRRLAATSTTRPATTPQSQPTPSAVNIGVDRPNRGDPASTPGPAHAGEPDGVATVEGRVFGIDDEVLQERVAEARLAALDEGRAAGYAQGKRAGRNEAKAAALVEARLAARRQVSAEFDVVARERIRDELAEELRAEIRDELEEEVEATRRAALADAKATRVAAQGIRARINADLAAARRDAELEISEMMLAARGDAEREAERILERSRTALVEAQRRDDRLTERENRLEAEAQRLDQQSIALREEAAQAAEREGDLAGREAAAMAELERVAGMTAPEAKDELLATQESAAKREGALLGRRIEQEAIQEATARAKKIVADSIARVASEQTAESVVAVMHLPNDDIKGRIIGREGRNIRAFETLTGVNLIIDDTPEAVLLSCFDPVRREIGRLTLEKLVADGRIHPHRIEEAYERSRVEVDEICARAAEDALLEVGIDDLHPELKHLLGRLRFRTSYGQNVLLHLIECAHIASAMAGELGVPAELVKRGAFLHDIGKAVTHEREGSHAIIGAELARKYGESEEVAHAIEAHHDEVAPQTIEAVLTQACDACSGGRPGARRESVEAYVERLERIESIASSQEGVERVFAMQAGREVRIMVRPTEVDDGGAYRIAKDVAAQIESELTYPGQIRVTVVRESRASEIAR